MNLITDQEEVEYHMQFFNKAALFAKGWSSCRKSRRGVVLVKYGEILSWGVNRTTVPELCEPCIRDDIHDNSRMELCPGTHAEMEALITSDRKEIEGADMYHAAIDKEGNLKPSDDTSCTFCSRHFAFSGGRNFYLYQSRGIAEHPADEFNRSSFRYFGFDV